MTSQLAHIFVDLMRASNPGAAQAAVDDLEQLLDASFRFFPVGGTPAECWRDGEIVLCNAWSNRNKVNIVADEMVALFERVRNGDDAVIELFQANNWFKNNPQDFFAAATEVAESDDGRPRVHIMTTEEQVGGIRTAIVIDEGAGISADAFHRTIVGEGSLTKVNNKLVAGNLGIGGLQAYAFAAYTVIASRTYANPRKIAFTVVFKFHDPDLFGQKAGHSYVWLGFPDGSVPTVDIAEVEAIAEIAAPGQFRDDTYDLLKDHIVLPPHGTTVRMVGYPVPPRSTLWSYLRVMSFGVPLRHALVSGLSKQRGDADADEFDDEAENSGRKRKRVNYIQGMRDFLNSKVKGGRRNVNVEYMQPPVHIPYPNGKGFITLELWVMTSTSKSTPVEILFGKALANGLLVSVDGQPHARLPTKILLDKADLGSLNENICINVSLNGINYADRIDMFTSGREDLRETHRETIKQSVLSFLKDDDNLAHWNQVFRDRSVASSEPVGEVVAHLNRLLHTPQAGPIFTRFGGPGRPVDDGHGDDWRKPRGKPTLRRLIDLADPPSWLHLRKDSIESKQDEWFTVQTNAPDRYSDRMTLDIIDDDGTNLQILSRKGLQGGRESFLVRCGDARIGAVADVRARLTLFDGTELVSPIVKVHVVERPLIHTQTKLKRDRPTAPDVQVIAVKPSDIAQASFVQKLHLGTLDAEAVAFAMEKIDDGKYIAYLNMEFGDYQRLVAELKQHFGQNAVREFEDHYKMCCVVASLKCLDMDLPFVENELAFHLHKAGVLGTLVVTKYLAMLSDANLSRRKAA